MGIKACLEDKGIMQLKLKGKKQMRNRKRIIIAMMAAGCICAGGCGIKELSSEILTVVESMTAVPEEAAAAPEEEPPTSPADTARPPETDTAALEAYSAALEAIFSQNIWPDGKEIDEGEYKAGGFSGNKFAVCDVDGDGREELLLNVTSASMAGMFESVYDYDPDTGTITEEFRAFPMITYYDNGIAKCEWSHNQGHGAKLWPFTLYEYDSDTDTYVYRGSVDSWDRDLAAEGFPSEYDADGDGTVYFLYDDENMTDSTTVDGEEYQQWLDSFLTGGEEIRIEWKDLNEETIKM